MHIPRAIDRVYWTLSLVFIMIVMALVFSVRSFGVSSPMFSSATTTVGGRIDVDTNWTEANSPYIVTSSVLVSEGVTLTIESEVIVKFDLGKAMQVDGQLIARGTDTKPIVFTSLRDDTHGGDSNGDGNLTEPAAGDWAYVLFTDPSVDATFDIDGNYVGGSILEDCIVTFGGGRELTGSQGVIRIDFSAPFLNYDVICGNANHGVCINQGGPTILNSNISQNGYGSTSTGSGIYANNYPNSAAVTIVGNTLTGNSREGIHVENYGGSVSRILNNTVTSNGGRGIFVDGGSGGSGGTHSYVITGNQICHNRDGGIHASGANLVITNNIIAYNDALATGSYYGCVGGGMYVFGAGYMQDVNMIISNNVVASNTASYAGAVYLGISEHASLEFSYNSIVGNFATNDAVACVSKDPTHPEYACSFTYNLVTQNSDNSTISSSVKISGSPIINYNSFFGNFYNYEIYNTNAAGPSHNDATNNWWGSSNETVIQARIFDWFDDAALGIVDYLPYENFTRTDVPISPPTNVTVEAEGANLTLNWNSNPESDMAGYKIYYDIDSAYPYKYSIDVGNVTGYTLTGLPPNAIYLTVTAYDADADGSNDLFEGHESWYAHEAIADFNPPTIETPSRIPPGDVQMYQQVNVSVDATDIESGIKNVTLSYTVNDGASWENLTMYQNVLTNLYEATIPGQQLGTWVKYKIVAYDYAGNNATLEGTQPYLVYLVVPEFPTFLILPLFTIATLLAVTVHGKKCFDRSNRKTISDEAT